MRLLLASVVLLIAAAAPDSANRASLSIVAEPLGDTEQGVVSRITFRYAVPDDVPPGVPLVVQGSILRGTEVLKNYRIQLLPEQREMVSTIQTLPEGEIMLFQYVS